MHCARTWDASCPVKYLKWQADDDIYTIEDLHPEDDEQAIQMYITEYVPDQLLSTTIELYEDESSVREMQECWRKLFSFRTSLGCYREYMGTKELVAVNCLRVKTKDEPQLFNQDYSHIKAFQIFQILFYMESQRNLFEELGVQQYLSGLGVSVAKQYRGIGIGEQLVAAREPLCKNLGLKAAVTVSVGPSIQRSASKCGFSTLTLVTFGKLAADTGMTDLSKKDQSRTAKLMIKKYN